MQDGMTLGEVARMLEVTPGRVSQLVAEGRIHYTVTPLGKLYDPESVQQILIDRLRRERLRRERREARLAR